MARFSSHLPTLPGTSGPSDLSDAPSAGRNSRRDADRGANRAARRALAAVREAARAVVEPLEDRRMLSAVPSMVSVNYLGTGGGNGPSDEASVTSDGRFIAFSSSATDLVPNDSNAVRAIYLRDTQTNTTTLVSVGLNGAPANGASASPKVSDDGRFVVFASDASNLVANDTNGVTDIFLRDLVTGTTTRVSASASGGNADKFSGEPVISADGNYVAYTSLADNLTLQPVSSGHNNVFIWSRQTGQTKLVSVNAAGNNGGNGSSFDPSLSAGGANVTFRSNSTDLETAIPTTGDYNVYLRNLSNSTTTLVSVNQAGTAGGDRDSTSAAVNNNGTLVVFRSGANDLVPNDQNNNDDVFLRDTSNNTTTLLSADFQRTGTAHGFSEFPTISNDGHYAAFSSTAPDLIPNNTNATEQVYIRDLQAGPIYLVSTNASGAPANQPSYHTYLSGNGQFVSFTSGASDLSSMPNSGTTQIYVASVPAVTLQPTPTPTPTPGTPTPTPTPVPTGPDTTAPTAAIDTEQTPPTTNSPTYDFLVDLADNVALNTVSVGNLNVTAPSGAVLPAHVVNVIGSGPSAYAFYEFSPADNALATTDSGTYTVSAPPGAIKDAAGNDLTKATNAAVTVGTFNITVNPPNSADLVGTISGKFPASALAGAAGKATLTIKNQGLTAVTKQKITVNLYLSETTTLVPHATAFKAVPLTLSLKPQKTKRLSLNFKFPTGLPNGNYYLVTKIDPANVVPETNKVNNVTASPVTIQVAPAFVALSGVSVASSGALIPGGKGTVLLTVKNNGNTPANGTLNINLTSASSAGDATGSGTAIGTASAKIHVKPGGTQRLKLRPTITAIPAVGTFLSATIDPSNAFHNPTPGGNVVTSATSF